MTTEATAPDGTSERARSSLDAESLDAESSKAAAAAKVAVACAEIEPAHGRAHAQLEVSTAVDAA